MWQLDSWFVLNLLNESTGGLFAVVCWGSRLRVKGANRFHEPSFKDSDVQSSLTDLTVVGVKVKIR